MTTNNPDIPDLLHEAQLLSARWTLESSQVSLVFDCLRRCVDGAEMEDRRVEIRLVGVSGVATYCSPAGMSVCPSKLWPDGRVAPVSLEDWADSASEAFLSVDSKQQDFVMMTSSDVHWLLGDDLEQCGQREKFGVHLQAEVLSSDAIDCDRAFYFDCQDIQVSAKGTRLSLDQWAAEYEAWWRSWGDHWDTKSEAGDTGDAQAPSLEDTFIPAGDDPPPDLSYRPPDRPAYLVDNTDAPRELLEPVRAMHEAILTRDWERLAHAYPNFDRTLGEQAKHLESQYLGFDFGRWFYIRQVDGWWMEGKQACVTVRGVEHTAPDDEDSPENKETVIKHALRKSDNGWRILNLSQGWPDYGSAKSFDGPKPWLDEWEMSGD